jgi:hypothetical protein
MKYKKYQAVRESNPAFALNQIGKIALNRAKAGEQYQQLEIITAQLMCALTMEAVFNRLGKKLFDNWERVERSLRPKDKLKMIAQRTGLEINLGSRPFQFLPEIFGFRDSLVHAKYSRLSTNEIHENEIDENGFPIVQSVQDLLTNWEKLCSIETAEKWRKAVESISSILSEAANCQNPIKVDGAIDTWGELEI